MSCYSFMVHSAWRCVDELQSLASTNRLVVSTVWHSFATCTMVGCGLSLCPGLIITFAMVHPALFAEVRRRSYQPYAEAKFGSSTT